MLWPTSIRNPSVDFFKQKYVKSQIKSTFENGTVQSRPKFTRGRWVFTLGWSALPESEYQTLQEFFDANQGLIFDWPHPVSGKIYTVRFGMDELPEASFAGFVNGETAWQLSGVILEEA